MSIIQKATGPNFPLFLNTFPSRKKIKCGENCFKQLFQYFRIIHLYNLNINYQSLHVIQSGCPRTSTGTIFCTGIALKLVNSHSISLTQIALYHYLNQNYFTVVRHLELDYLHYCFHCVSLTHKESCKYLYTTFPPFQQLVFKLYKVGKLRLTKVQRLMSYFQALQTADFEATQHLSSETHIRRACKHRIQQHGNLCSCSHQALKAPPDRAEHRCTRPLRL